MSKVSCIIPAYNEAPRIENVLGVVYKHPLIDEVIVVDDHSTDNTSSVVGKFPGVRMINHGVNKGKSLAVVTGVRESAGDTIFLLDADLIGLNADNVSRLIEPVTFGVADVSFSVRRISFFADIFYRLVGMDILTGERVFKKSLIEDRLEEISRLSRFGIETFFNNVIMASKSRIRVVFWDNVRSPLKASKQGVVSGIIADMRMFGDILKTTSVSGIARQFAQLRRLRV
ncbi:MAG: glycosyltransferase family 2 protein [Candidatus Vogelbacteria bacterium]|nr:glycosyltransferase family 2 protein [Candidatus Vogelbacteria bacterium]